MASVAVADTTDLSLACDTAACPGDATAGRERLVPVRALQGFVHATSPSAILDPQTLDGVQTVG